MSTSRKPTTDKDDVTDQASNTTSSSFVSYWTDRFYDFSNKNRLQRLHECREMEKLLHRRREILSKLPTTFDNTTISQEQQQLKQELELRTPADNLRRKLLLYFQWKVDETDTPSSLSPSFSALQRQPLNPLAEATGETNMNHNVKNGTDHNAMIFDDGSNNNNSSNGNTTITSATSSHIRSMDDPAKHEHMIWGCRAMVLTCGYHLLKLRSCLHENYHFQKKPLPIPNYDIHKKGRKITSTTSNNDMNHGEHGQEEKVVDSSSLKDLFLRRFDNHDIEKGEEEEEQDEDPCRSIQRTMARCVTHNIVRMEKRVAANRNLPSGGTSTSSSSSSHS